MAFHNIWQSCWFLYFFVAKIISPFSTLIVFAILFISEFLLQSYIILKLFHSYEKAYYCLFGRYSSAFVLMYSTWMQNRSFLQSVFKKLTKLATSSVLLLTDIIFFQKFDFCIEKWFLFGCGDTFNSWNHFVRLIFNCSEFAILSTKNTNM